MYTRIFNFLNGLIYSQNDDGIKTRGIGQRHFMSFYSEPLRGRVEQVLAGEPTSTPAMIDLPPTRTSTRADALRINDGKGRGLLKGAASNEK